MEINKIYNQDCFEGMERMIEEGMKVDLIVTDPPYILGGHKSAGGGNSAITQRAKRMAKTIEWITDDFDWERCFELFLKLQNTPNMLIFCSNKQLSRTMKFFEDKGISTTCLIWHKTNPIPAVHNIYASDIEFVIFVRGDGATFNAATTPFDYKKKVYTSGIVPTHNRLHPTCRLVELHSNEGDLVLDAFMGSGTTAIACIKHKRNFIGFELNEEFYKVATNRINHEDMNLSLF